MPPVYFPEHLFVTILIHEVIACIKVDFELISSKIHGKKLKQNLKSSSIADFNL